MNFINTYPVIHSVNGQLYTWVKLACTLPHRDVNIAETEVITPLLPKLEQQPTSSLVLDLIMGTTNNPCTSQSRVLSLASLIPHPMNHHILYIVPHKSLPNMPTFPHPHGHHTSSSPIISFLHLPRSLVTSHLSVLHGADAGISEKHKVRSACVRRNIQQPQE